MELQLDLTKEYGIVLEGGGAKGSYQIGAWKALKEAGIQIKGIAGASVGALNGALMCMDDLEKAEYIWENISYSKVMDVDDGMMESVRKGDILALDFKQIAEDAKRLLKEKGFDITPLKELIDSAVDEERIRSSRRELYIVTYSVTDRKLLMLDARDIPEGEIGDMLLASAYFPAFKNTKLKGKRYMDGGSLNNVPINVLLEQGYKDILVIRIYGLGFDTEKIVEIPEDVSVHRIAPRQDLGGILEFDRRQARKNIALGYYDAKRLLYGLQGKWYYIDAPKSEAYYFEKMMSELRMFRSYWPELDEAHIPRNLTGYRVYTEWQFPMMAEGMGLKEDWTYKDLYLGVLEHVARKHRISRFKIYTDDQLKQAILKKLPAQKLL